MNCRVKQKFNKNDFATKEDWKNENNGRVA
jgi:hypothetical protein